MFEYLLSIPCVVLNRVLGLTGADIPVAQVRDSAVLCQRMDARGGVAQRDQDDLGPQGRHPLLILGQARIMFSDNCKASKYLHTFIAREGEGLEKLDQI